MTIYKLIGRLPVPVDDVVEWSQWFGTADRQVARDLVGPLMVSTVFLGVDHNYFDDGPPILFETMVFGGEACDEYAESYCERYSTWDEAEKGHAVAVAWARDKVEKVEAALAPPTTG